MPPVDERTPAERKADEARFNALVDKIGLPVYDTANELICGLAEGSTAFRDLGDIEVEDEQAVEEKGGGAQFTAEGPAGPVVVIVRLA
jgi:hypothetical protein